MNVTINIYGDVHIHCDCCDGCGVYDDNFDDALEAPHEAVPDAEDGGEQVQGIWKIPLLLANRNLFAILPVFPAKITEIFCQKSNSAICTIRTR